jgi:hypothetical protein
VKKEEQQKGIENSNLLVVKEKPQELYQQQSNISIAKGKSKLKETKVKTLKRQLVVKLLIDQFYSFHFNTYIHYRWVQSSIIQRYSANVLKKNKFSQVARNHSLTDTLIACT